VALTRKKGEAWEKRGQRRSGMGQCRGAMYNFHKFFKVGFVRGDGEGRGGKGGEDLLWRFGTAMVKTGG